jgi:hypothetical protein
VYYNGEGFPDAVVSVVSHVQTYRNGTTFVNTRQLPGIIYTT